MAVRLNEDAELVAHVKRGLKEKGGYCPCRIPRTPENKCICKQYSDNFLKCYFLNSKVIF